MSRIISLSYEKLHYVCFVAAADSYCRTLTL
jgi:hypothetical protein